MLKAQSSLLKLSLLALACLTLQAADEPKKPAAKPAKDPSKWESMDYGRFLTASIDNTYGKNPFGNQGCATNKAVVVNLGNKDAGVAFDTDTLRLSGAWTGGWMKLKGVAFDGAHGPNPGPATNATVYAESNPGPGWSHNGSFADPRKLPVGPANVMSPIPLGPLPREHAKYQGLYLNGDRVTFAYSVGSANLLESHDLEKVGDQSVLSRSFTVVNGNLDASVKLLDLCYGGKIEITNNIARTTLIVTTQTKGADGKMVEKKTEQLTVVSVSNGQLAQVDKSLVLKLQVAAGSSVKVSFAHGEPSAVDALTKAAQGAPAAQDLRAFTKAGPAHWKEDVVTEGILGEVDQSKQADAVKAQIEKAADGAKKEALKEKLAEIVNAPYLVDNVTVPAENPYHSWIRVGGIDFFKDGRIAFSTWSGDVWVGKFSDDKLTKITWHRYATGIFHALGLKIVDDVVYVLGRDQITRLHDLNGDGEADFYENFNNDVQVTSGFHEFTFDLQTDSQGNFYFLKGGPVNPGGRGWGPLSDHNGCIFKVSPDGKKFEVYATGLRAPNGMGVGPNNEISNGDNQGTWVPVDYIHYSKPGDFIEVPDLSHRTPAPTKYSPHLCWIPYDIENSNGAQVWVTSKKWGPFEGRMMYLSYGKSSLFGVLQETVGDVMQGGTFKFPLKFTTGLMRGRFNPADGQLYTGGLRGWQTNGAKDGAIHRVRYTGKSVTLPETLHVTTAGISIGFTGALDRKSAEDVQNYSIVQYNYHWTSAYGSDEYKMDGTKGNDTVPVKGVKLSADGKTISLDVPGLKPVEQIRVKMNIKAVDGTRLPDEVYHTINVVPEKQGEDYRSFAK
jgi:hypothetical protein